MGKIGIHGFHVSHKWGEMKSRSRSFHVNFANNPLLSSTSLKVDSTAHRVKKVGQITAIIVKI